VDIISQITEDLYIGTQPDAADYEMLRGLGVRLVINMRREFPPPEHNAPEVETLWLPTTDTPFTPIPMVQLERGAAAALEAFDREHKVFVHCAYGRHRSVAMICAILIAQGRSADNAMDLTMARHPRADPHLWYIQQRIRQFERRWWRGGAPPFDPRRVGALLFDLDGTLADTDDAYIQRLARRLRPFSFLFYPQRDPVPFLRWALNLAESPLNFLMTLPDRLGLDLRLEGVVNRFRRERAAGHFLLIEGVRPMLERLSQRYPLALVTSRNEAAAEAFLDQFELRPYFRSLVTAFSAPRIKPHPAPVSLAAQELGMRVENCVMVGDTTVDMVAGRRAGAQAIGVLCGFGEKDELIRSGANLILASTADVGDWEVRPAARREQGLGVRG
jgi:HAD superfamily hydrolase (TIGR01509 family)